ncbi:MAG: TIM barrel protein [Ilumatobacteraceae bacterium]
MEAADRPNGGLCLDIWHSSARRGESREIVAALPGHRVMAVQMSDGPLQPDEPDYRDDCLRHRVAPGSGEMDAVGYVRAVVAAGYDGPGRWRSATTPSGTARVLQITCAGRSRACAQVLAAATGAD